MTEWMEGVLPRGVLTLTEAETDGVDSVGEGGGGIGRDGGCKHISAKIFLSLRY